MKCVLMTVIKTAVFFEAFVNFRNVFIHFFSVSFKETSDSSFEKCVSSEHTLRLLKDSNGFPFNCLHFFWFLRGVILKTTFFFRQMIKHMTSSMARNLENFQMCFSNVKLLIFLESFGNGSNLPCIFFAGEDLNRIAIIFQSLVKLLCSTCMIPMPMRVENVAYILIWEVASQTFQHYWWFSWIHQK